MNKKTIIIILAITLALGACSPSSNLAVQSVENYYQALVKGDVEGATSLVCAEWEPIAQMEVDSFNAVEASLDNFSCEETGEDGETTLVSCMGKILMSYDGEEQSIDLSARTYQVIEQGGDWLFCGYR